eukprot:CAMPEP_0168461010 /NCGR_PEP_ID=MMETSP0228-20121227/53746_1 /TAXON_ID=133427 /ORGANISM="Protoceratium reticulatum, Strain CCCM 535 (=CCMP 1889)" /LENGTH=47 /DNA_ID= /DNA_START= /DNA_END= /DNA_ORIENTATION=
MAAGSPQWGCLTGSHRSPGYSPYSAPPLSSTPLVLNMGSDQTPLIDA